MEGPAEGLRSLLDNVSSAVPGNFNNPLAPEEEKEREHQYVQVGRGQGGI